MTSAKFSGFWTPSLPLSVPNSRNLPSFGQNLSNPLPPPQSRCHMCMPPSLVRIDSPFYVSKASPPPTPLLLTPPMPESWAYESIHSTSETDWLKVAHPLFIAVAAKHS